MGIGQTVFAMAGVKAKAFLDACERHGKSGAEFLAGIPCSVGGAVFMNAGAHGKHISDILESALVYKEGRIRVTSAAECEYSYKHSVFMRDGSVILGASFVLEDADAETVAKKRAEYLEKRRRLPAGRSMGCTFKNPPAETAGKLIEGAGSGAGVGGGDFDGARKFIINEGGTSADVRALSISSKRRLCATASS
ncbi:MAG: FAD-binding protein [Christensenellaceae bacterium]